MTFIWPKNMNKDIKGIHNAPVLLVLLDDQGRVLQATDKALTEVPGACENLGQVLNAFQLDTDQSAVWESFEQGRPMEFFARDPDATIWQFSLSFDAEQETAALVARDVSADYERILRNRILLDLINKTPDYVGIARGDHSGLWVNESMRRVLDVSEEELQNTTVESAHPHGLGPYSIADALAWAKRDGHVTADTTLHNQNTGEGTEVSLVFSAHHDPLQDEYFFSALERDISQFRATERELLQTRSDLQQALENTTQTLQKRESEIDYSEDVWRSLVEYSHDLVLFTDERGIILFNNQGFLPTNNQDLRGSSAFALFTEHETPNLHGQFQELLGDERQHINLEANCICGQNTGKRCVILINRLERASGSHAATWVVSDATESHETQRLLLAQEKMAATGRMAARVAHEINNPLAAIRSSLELIRLDQGAGAPVDDTVALMDRELERVSNIIRQMYGLYQPERDTVQSIDITSITADCLSLLHSSARQQEVALDFNCPDSLYALASEAGLRKVLFNVIQNAICASPAGDRVFVGMQEREETIIISVDDHGPGLPEDMALQVFEPFFTTRDSYNGQGLGLGLSVSSSLVKGMGGSLELQNRPEGGARAVITLKAASGITSEGQ